jgi:hypothetical protein
MSWRACLVCAATTFVWILIPALPARAEWTSPVQLSGTGGNVQIAEDGRGDAFAAWEECRSGCREMAVITDYLPAGSSSWQPPVQVSTGAANYLAQIAADSSGEGIAVWGSPAGPQSAVRPASLGAWQPPLSVSASSGETSDLRLAVDPVGDAVAIWQREHTIEAAVRSAATGAWEAPFAISAPGEDSSEPRVAIREGGELAALWRVYEPETVPCPSPPSSAPCALIVRNKQSLKTAFRPDGGPWQVPVTLASAETVYQPQVSLDSAGAATALWEASNGGSRTIESSLRPTGGGWLAPVTLSLTGANQPETSLQLAVDAQGNATAAWVHGYTTSTGSISGVTAVETAVRNAQGAWQAPSVISGSEPHAGSVRLAENASGAAAAVWSCSTLSPYPLSHYPLTVRGAIRPTPGAEWRPAVDISPAEGGSADVAVGPDGRAIVIWDEIGPFTTPAPPAGIYASMYQAGLTVPGVRQSGGCGAGSSAAVSAPLLSHVRMTHTRFRVGRTPTAISAKTVSGTAFLFDLNATGDIGIELSRLVTGLKRGHRCLVPSRALRRVHAKRCQRAVAIAKLTRRSVPAGKDRVPFTGRVGRRPLRGGNYTARLTASNAAGKSPAVVLRFKIIRR